MALAHFQRFLNWLRFFYLYAGYVFIDFYKYGYDFSAFEFDDLDAIGSCLRYSRILVGQENFDVVDSLQ